MKSRISLGLCAVVLLGACTSTPGPSPRANSEPTPLTRQSTAPALPEKDGGLTHTCTASAARAIGGRERQVRIELTPCRVTPRESPNLVLVNEGRTDIGYSFGFGLEKKTSSGWRLVNRRQGFPLPLFYLRPGESSKPQPVEVYFDEPRPVRLTPGVYRVTKSVNLKPGEPRPPSMSVSIRFRVQVPR